MDSSRPGSGAFLRIDQLTKRFDGLAAGDGVALDIQQGEIFALLGSSGCGKSTLLRMLAGFETPTEGAIWLEGQDMSRLPPYVRPINMMFQSYALFPHLTVAGNVAFGLKRQGLPRAQIEQRVNDVLGLVQMRPYLLRKPHQLSGGQQQRVALARSLALQPRLLLLDEPLGALDRKLREQTQFELKSIIKRVGVTCVMVTHDQEEAMTMADRIAVMSAGKFLQVGRPQDIYETPNSRFVADFIGNVNLFDGVLEQDQPDHCTVTTAHGDFYVGHGVTGTPGTPMTVAVRPEKFELALRREDDVLPRFNALAGTVVERAYFGSQSVYRVQLASGLRLQVSMPNVDRHGDQLDLGSEVVARVAPQALVVLAR